jgi:hypothetical protein
MAASMAAGQQLPARFAGASEFHDSNGLDASLNLRGGVWEVRDIFLSSQNPPVDGSSGGGTSSHFDENHGPLVAIMTSEEAVYAPVLATLAPHKSYAWMYVDTHTTSRSVQMDAAAMRWLFASSLLRLQVRKCA